MQVGEDEAGDLDQSDDKGSLGHGAQVVAERPPRGGDDGQGRDLRLVPVVFPHPDTAHHVQHSPRANGVTAALLKRLLFFRFFQAALFQLGFYVLIVLSLSSLAGLFR